MIATMYSVEEGGSCSLSRKRHLGDTTEIYEEKGKRVRDYYYPRDENRIIIPQGWLDCPSFGKEIGCIIPSKAPLSESYNNDLPRDKTYSFKQYWISNGIGLVIDLTNTTRYYNPTTELRQKGIKHVKIRCSGHDSVPDNVSVNTFVNEVNQFERHGNDQIKLFKRRNFSKKYVLVHCTHGHNRTGFMIVHYLMRSRPMMSVTQALKIFSDARPPGIYKADYIDALYSFYHEIKPERFIVPQTPEWKMSENEPPRSCLSVQENNQEEEEEKVEKKMSNDDILGDEIPYNQELSYQRFCYAMLKISGGTMYFPGSHPVSLDREQFQLLKEKYYYATWKADGTRYMMLLTREGCYLIDRKFRFRRVQMRFPCSDDHKRLHHYTLLDGEMVVDTFLDKENKKQCQVRRYLVYDLVAINGESVVERPFSERWNTIDREVIKPRDDEKKVRRSYRYEMEPFGVRIKAFCLLSALEKKIFKKLIPLLTHEADGVIFQGWDEPYVYRENRDLLKWKYPHLNSVDFLFEMDRYGRKMLFLKDYGRKKLMEGYSVEFRGDGWNKPESYRGKILECSWDREKEVWVAMRIRVDKDQPNGLQPALRVIKSINDNITEEVLLDEIKEIINLPMYVERIKMDTLAAERHRHGTARPKVC